MHCNKERCTKSVVTHNVQCITLHYSNIYVLPLPAAVNLNLVHFHILGYHCPLLSLRLFLSTFWWGGGGIFA